MKVKNSLWAGDTCDSTRGEKKKEVSFYFFLKLASSSVTKTVQGGVPHTISYIAALLSIVLCFSVARGHD